MSSTDRHVVHTIDANHIKHRLKLHKLGLVVNLVGRYQYQDISINTTIGCNLVFSYQRPHGRVNLPTPQFL